MKLLLVPTGASPQAQPATGKAKVDRLVMGLINPYRDYMRPWINGTPDHNIQHDPAFEWLFEVDVSSGGYNPWLAKSFEMAKDGRSWRIKLQKGVQFHHGYGEFTAKDVVHNHEVVMHCKVVCLDLLFYYSSASSMIIFSKAQWDKEGENSYETKPAGTGPYMFKERQLGRYVLYERAPAPHWKWGVVDWKEIQMTWSVEEPSRFAQLLVGESHLTELNRDLTDDAIAKGFKLIRSRQVAQQTVIAFGGLYFGTEDKATKRYAEFGGITGRLDPKVPWTNKKVRQPMNKAINRDEILKVMYKGRAAPTYVAGFYPDLPGWDPTWQKRFPEMYGYDLKKAKQLLAEAGYPNGFKAKAWLFPFAGAPELVQVMEAVATQLREVGIELELEESDLVSVVQPKVRERRANWYLRGGVPTKKAVEPQISLFNAGKG